MSKTKLYILAGIFLCLVVGITVASIRIVKAKNSTTFPVDKAGIAAYVKVDNIGNIDISTLAEAYHTIEASGESYVIGTVKVPNEVDSNYPHLYVGLDGWIVAYYLKTEEASRIMQWKGYTVGSINTTTLKDAIDYMCEKIGVTYSGPIKYYDFEFPDANKMTLVADSSDFYATVPGTLYEASYQVLLRSDCCSGSLCRYIELKVDEILVYKSSGLGCNWGCNPPFSTYGSYDLSNFSTGITHHVTFSGCNWKEKDTIYATVLIYKN